MVQVQDRALNGDLVTISAQTVSLEEPVSGDITFADSRGSTFGFQTGPKGVGEQHLVLGAVPDFQFDEFYSYSGGELRVGSFVVAEDTSSTRTDDWSGDVHLLGEWYGDWHSVLVFVRVSHESQIDIRTWFELVDIEDSPQGAVVRPKTSVELDELAVTKDIPGVGLCRIKPIELAASVLPAWAGAKVDGGELYAIRMDQLEDIDGGTGAGAELPGGAHHHEHLDMLALVGDSAYVEVAPPSEAVSAEDQLAHLEHIVFEWREEVVASALASATTRAGVQ